MEQENNDFDERESKKSFLVILCSLIMLSLIIFIGVILFFPNKNVIEEIAKDGLSIENKQENLIEDKALSEKEGLIIEENNDEIIIDLEKLDLSKEELEEKREEEKPKKVEEKKQEKAEIKKPIKKVSEKTISKKIDSTPEKRKETIIPSEENLKKYDPNKTYYIQYGSFKNPRLAEDNIKSLENEKINAKIYSANVNNEDIYRVRSGPYRTKYDAKIDLNKVKSLAKFKDSYIITEKVN